MIFNMKRQIFLRALIVGLCASAFLFNGCSTTETRISDHPEIFQTLSPNDQALVKAGKIREGMSQNAVWLAWGVPDQKATGVARGKPVETWIYNEYTYANAPYPYPYGPFGYGGYFGGGIGIMNLAMLAALGMTDIHAMNKLKVRLGGVINGVATVTFVATKAIVWPQAMIMTAGSVLGGYSTAQDLLRLLNALRAGKIANAPAAGMIGIAGGAPGLNAVMEGDLEGGYDVIVLANLDPPAAEKMGRALRERIRGSRP